MFLIIQVCTDRSEFLQTHRVGHCLSFLHGTVSITFSVLLLWLALLLWFYNIYNEFKQKFSFRIRIKAQVVLEINNFHNTLPIWRSLAKKKTKISHNERNHKILLKLIIYFRAVKHTLYRPTQIDIYIMYK